MPQEDQDVRRAWQGLWRLRKVNSLPVRLGVPDPGRAAIRSRCSVDVRRSVRTALLLCLPKDSSSVIAHPRLHKQRLWSSRCCILDLGFLAGITTFHPLKRYVKPGSRVGIIGIGGLGHVAVQFAAKMGAVVTAISRSDSKKDQARLLLVSCSACGQWPAPSK